MSGAINVQFTSDMRPFMRTAPARMVRAAVAATSSMAPEIEGYMKLNAPWTDQTSNARNGLAARSYHEGDEVGVVLFHQVDYGIWLETRFGGRYAIIDPTIEIYGPKLMERYDRLLERI